MTKAQQFVEDLKNHPDVITRPELTFTDDKFIEIDVWVGNDGRLYIIGDGTVNIGLDEDSALLLSDFIRRTFCKEPDAHQHQHAKL